MTTGLLFFVQRFEDHVEVYFVIFRKLCIEYRTQQILLYGRKGHLPFGLLLDQFIDHVRIDPCETCSLVLLSNQLMKWLSNWPSISSTS